MTNQRSAEWVCLVLVCVALQGGPASAGETHAEQVGPKADPPAPAWSLVDVDGRRWSSESLLGSVIVLEFWATWCPKCRANMPEVARLARDYESDAVQVLAVSIYEKADPVAYLQEHRLEVNLASDGDEVADRFGIVGTPSAVVVDPEGRIALRVQGAGEQRTKQLRETVDRLLKRSSTAEETR